MCNKLSALDFSIRLFKLIRKLLLNYDCLLHFKQLAVIQIDFFFLLVKSAAVPPVLKPKVSLVKTEQNIAANIPGQQNEHLR